MLRSNEENQIKEQSECHFPFFALHRCYMYSQHLAYFFWQKNGIPYRIVLMYPHYVPLHNRAINDIIQILERVSFHFYELHRNDIANQHMANKRRHFASLPQSCSENDLGNQQNCIVHKSCATCTKIQLKPRESRFVCVFMFTVWSGPKLIFFPSLINECEYSLYIIIASTSAPHSDIFQRVKKSFCCILPCVYFSSFFLFILAVFHAMCHLWVLRYCATFLRIQCRIVDCIYRNG